MFVLLEGCNKQHVWEWLGWDELFSVCPTLSPLMSSSFCFLCGPSAIGWLGLCCLPSRHECSICVLNQLKHSILIPQAAWSVESNHCNRLRCTVMVLVSYCGGFLGYAPVTPLNPDRGDGIHGQASDELLGGGLFVPRKCWWSWQV